MALFSTSLWATDYLLIKGNDNASTATLNTADFWTQGTFSAKSNGGDFKKCIVLNGNISAGETNINYPTRYISYGVKTTDVTLSIKVYQSNSTAKKINIYEINEAADGSLTVTNKKEETVSKGLQTVTFTATPSAGTRSTIYITSQAASYFEFYQITASETGTNLANIKGGRVGYSIDYSKKSRLATKSGEDAMLDSVLYYHLSSDYKVNNGTNVQLKTGSYIKFKTVEPLILTLVTTSAYTFYVATSSDGTTNAKSEATTHNIKLRTADDWYIIGGASSATVITKMSFTAAPKVTYNANGGGSSMAQTYFTIAANGFTAPTNKEFKEWNTLSTGLGDTHEVGEEIEEDITLYAIWQDITEKFNVTYDLGGASGDAPTQAATAEGVKITLADKPSYAGHVFKGWLCDIDAEVYYPGDKYTMTAAATTFTAQWEEEDCKIFSFTGEIGTAENTAGEATVSESSLVLANTAARIKLTPEYGYSFKSGDKITISGMVGDTAKAYGLIVYATNGSTKLADFSVKGSTVPLVATATLSADAEYVFLARKGGTTTTINTCEITHSCADGTAAGLAYAENVNKTVGDAAFTNTLTNANDLVIACYASSDTTIAKVNATNGQVTVVAAGEATITAYSALQTQSSVLYAAGTATYTLTVSPKTAMENTKDDVKAIKRIENGMLIIEKNGKTYNVMGQEIK